MIIRSDPQSARKPAGSPSFGRHLDGGGTPQPLPEPPADAAPAAPAPAAPAPEDALPRRPTATFAMPPRAKAAAQKTAVPDVAQKTAVPSVAQKPRPVKPQAPQWTFDGVVYDLLTTKGVFGVRLVFVDGEGSPVGSTETNEDGRYRVSLPAGPPAGYALRPAHDDYSGKHIDELASTSSLRKADLEQRKFLMQASARTLPWVGVVGQSTRRDLALIPRSPEEP